MPKRDTKLNAALANAMSKDSRTDRTKFKPADAKTQTAIQKAKGQGRLPEGWLGEN
ncbi:hypothetical protein [Micromonospora sp. ALFpr18c]|uniref:hypothetical protein n=1 Tax=Micromonospora sp. ALFpr18c TaxID=1458665 RepID=UPI001788B797|nr:hypothetical protein [Micromonospora sp. ALFpr18c]